MISLGIFGIDNAVMAITALLTGAGLVALAMWLAGLISPRSFNPQKGEAYECGIPTRGVSMTRFHVGYYLFAILFLMFDVETVRSEERRVGKECFYFHGQYASVLSVARVSHVLLCFLPS